MDSLRYIHAADLHLDTPFRGIAQTDGQLSRLLREAAFTAMERLFRFCESEKPDFLVLAGDIYNQEDHSIKAQLALRDGCVRLQRLGIHVFLAHGNHDPLSSRLAAVTWPDNVTIFGPAPEQHVFEKNGTPLAVVHGISHERNKESRNLAKLFRRDARHDCFQLGVLHCAVEGQTAGQQSYAPCSLENLRDAGLDAWALGHVHERRVLSDTPFIAYCGNSQGLHINEAGERGCFLVTVQPQSGRFVCEESFLRLGPVQWECLRLDLEGMSKIDDMEQRLGQLLQDKADEAGPGCEALVVRVLLAGYTEIDAALRQPDCLPTVAGRLAHLHESASPGIWIKDFQLQTQPVMVRDPTRNDLLGCVWQCAEEMEKNTEKLQDAVNKILASRPALLKKLTMVNEEEKKQLLHEAERLCAGLLLP
ncbi:MAG: DNA repair exonuclease [Desulfovibrio sp.]|jgi:DNA repair exonuclease SbcCD nuclease subunit|nr:DNA repair exonuclease [Desulfovibrio sp.]